MKYPLKYILLIAIVMIAFGSCTTSKNKQEPPGSPDHKEVIVAAGDTTTPAPVSSPETKPANLTATMIAGTWNLTEKISHQQLKSFLGNEIGSAEYAEMSLTGTQIFQPEGKYQSKGQMTILIRNSQTGGEVRLLFNYDESGIWAIKGDTISGTVTGGAYTAADDYTKQVITESPELATALTPVKGERTKLVITSFKPGEMRLKDNESGWQSVLTR